jgi:DNA-binding transcriptional regulator YdaS (Cro superfamily)
MNDSNAWLDALRAERARTTQARVATRLGVSEGTVSQVLSGTYQADTSRIERRVRGELMGQEVSCRVLMDISMKLCQDVQERPRGAGSNPSYLQCHAACRGLGRWEDAGPCPHFQASKPKAGGAL